MAKILEFNDIVNQQDILNGFQKIKDQLDGIANSLKNMPEMKLNVSGTTGSLADLNQLIEATNKQKKAVSELSSVEKERLKVANDIERQQAKLEIAREKELTELDELKSKVRTATNERKAEGDSLEAMRAKLANLKQEYTQLNAAERENIKIGGQKLEELKNTDAAVKKLEEDMGVHTRSVGNYGKAWDGVKNILGSLGIAAGVGAIVSKLSATIKESVETIKVFESAMSRLSAVTGLTGVPLKELGDSAIEMSKKWGFSAKDIVENFTQVGSKMPDLLQNKKGMLEMSDAAMTLSKAGGIDLPQATLVLADAMNQWGAKSNEATKYIDVLALAAQNGSILIPGLTTAVVEFGGLAKESGIGIKDAAAAVEVLGKAMKSADPGKVGTGIRNVLTTLYAPDAFRKASAEFKEHNVNTQLLMDKTVSLGDKLKELSKIMNDHAAVVKVFGKDNIDAGLKLMTNADEINKFSENLNKSGGAMSQADTQMNNLQGSLDRLSANWDAVILSFNQSGEVTAFLRTIVDAITDFLQNSDNAKETLILIGKLLFDLGKTIFDIGKLLGIFKENTDKSGNAINDLAGDINNILEPLTTLIEYIDILTQSLTSVKKAGGFWSDVVEGITNSLKNILLPFQNAINAIKYFKGAMQSVGMLDKDIPDYNPKDLTKPASQTLDIIDPYSKSEKKKNIIAPIDPAGTSERKKALDEAKKAAEDEKNLKISLQDSFLDEIGRQAIAKTAENMKQVDDLQAKLTEQLGQDKRSRELLELSKDYENKKKILEDQQADLTTLNAVFLQQRAEIDKKYDEIADKEFETNWNKRLSKARSNVKLSLQILTQSEGFGEISINKKSALQELEDQYNKGLLIGKEYEKDKEEINNIARDKQIANVNKVANATKEIMGQTSQIVGSLKQMELDDLQAKEEKGLLTKEEVAKKTKEINKKYADSEFAVKVAEIIANTAIGITAALKNPATAPFVIPLVAATGAVELAVANKQREAVKKLRKGEINIGGKYHEQGGELYEIEHGESVINREATSESKNMLTLINKRKINDDLLKFVLFSPVKLALEQTRQNEKIESLLMENNVSNYELINYFRNKPERTIKGNIEIIRKGNVTIVNPI